MIEYYLHEQVDVLNPYTLLWQSGKIMGKFFDFTDPDEGHVYSVEIYTGIISDIYPQSLRKLGSFFRKDCECGASISKQPGHSGRCPLFNQGSI